MERWYLGSMNDGLFIINAPPRPSTDDIVFGQHQGHPTTVINVTELPLEKAQALVDAHNALVDKEGSTS